jgi:hypothetical protein
MKKIRLRLGPLAENEEETGSWISQLKSLAETPVEKEIGTVSLTCEGESGAHTSRD